MTITVGKYTFNSWLRKGIGARINETDTLGAAATAVLERATVPVDVQVNTRPIHKDFALLGPGDVLGINPDAVVRTEPRDWITDFEPNYLAFIEFYDEDFVFRFTPARAAAARLRPWIALLVLEEVTPDTPGEFTRGNPRQLPLPTITVKAAALPLYTQTWAWTHVHTNESFPTATDFEKFLESLATPDHPNNDRIICRLMSPRHLKPNTAYGAFVVPAFETGRRAGLDPKQDLSSIDAQEPSWTDTSGDREFPVYYQWRFRTGENEDFEELVKRLEPRPADPRVGIRSMDGEKPGWGMTNGTDIGPILPADEKQTVVGLEGALKSPKTRSRPEVIDTARPFFAELEQILNEPEVRRGSQAVDPLPLVAPPIYGEHHARRHTVDVTNAGWLHVLNRDPRNRTPGGFGVRAIQENQENYVARAWTQVRKILEANNLVRLLAYAMQASRALYANLGARLADPEKLAFFSPVLRKVRGSATTLEHQLGTSTLPAAAVSGAMRRFVRPRGGVAKRLKATDATFTHGKVIRGLADGTLTPAPPKPVPADLQTDTGASGRLPGVNLPAWMRVLIRLRLLLLLLVLLLLVVVGLVTGAWAIVAGFAIAAVGGWYVLQMRARAVAKAGSISQPTAMVAAIQNAPQRPNFRFIETDPVITPPAPAGTQLNVGTTATSTSPEAVRFTEVTTYTPGTGGDSVEGRAFRRAALALNRRLSVTAPPFTRNKFDVANAVAKLSDAVIPVKAFPLRAAAVVRFPFAPKWLEDPEHLVSAMAYPDFDDPMYEKLRDISSELLLPNLQLIPPNTITLLETNPPFIESYIVGLNYEFGKELLWREYPTDRRGSYFRQFWDVRGIIAMPTDTDPAVLAEQGREVFPLDKWTSASALGSHRNPLRPPGEQVVLTVRGDLLKKYRNTLIYAQKAHRDPDGGDPIVSEVATEADVQTEIKFPAFKASIEPDIRFFGFAMTVEQARGDTNPQTDSDDWGWYFVIQQLPGEPRFGMDVTFSPDDDPSTPITWDDLAWSHFADTMAFVDTTIPPSSFQPAGPGESISQWGTDSARMASILYQRPVMILVHAKGMLEGTAT